MMDLGVFFLNGCFFFLLQNEWDLYDDVELQMMPGFDRAVVKNGK